MFTFRFYPLFGLKRQLKRATKQFIVATEAKQFLCSR